MPNVSAAVTTNTESPNMSVCLPSVVCNHANESTDGEKALSPMLLDKKSMTVILINDDRLDAPSIEPLQKAVNGKGAIATLILGIKP